MGSSARIDTRRRMDDRLTQPNSMTPHGIFSPRRVRAGGPGFLLGVKRGFDADHLAIIDGLTRYNGRANPRLAPCCGTLFSLGHGVVVLAVAMVTSLMMAGASVVPAWMEDVGAVTSIVFLTLLGCVNLRVTFRTPADEMVPEIRVRKLGSVDIWRVQMRKAEKCRKAK